MTREEAQLANRVLALAKGVEQTRVNITSSWNGNTRFADASITTSGGITDVIVEVTVTLDENVHPHPPMCWTKPP